MSDDNPVGLSAEELDAQEATALPDKEVVSILDLNADINLAIDAAAPIDLAVAANANVAAPIDAAVGANVLSVDSSARPSATRACSINQGLDADARAHATQDSALDQGAAAPARGRDRRSTPADRPRRRGRHHRPATAARPTTAAATAPAACRATGSRLDRGRRHRGRRPLPTATCSTWTSTSTPTPTSRPRSTARWRPTPTSPPRSTRPSAPTSARWTATRSPVSQQDAIINQDITGSADADVRPASDITQ